MGLDLLGQIIKKINPTSVLISLFCLIVSVILLFKGNGDITSIYTVLGAIPYIVLLLLNIHYSLTNSKIESLSTVIEKIEKSWTEEQKRHKSEIKKLQSISDYILKSSQEQDQNITKNYQSDLKKQYSTDQSITPTS